MASLGVIGLGLIGGSVLRAASAAGMPTWGYTTSAEDARAARSSGFAVAENLPAALRLHQGGLICIAVPLPAVDEVLRAIAEHAPQARLTDVVGVKAPVYDGVRRLAPQVRYVGGHPMAGTAESGWVAGSATLFSGANWVVCCEQDTELELWRDVAALAIACGARVVPAGVDAHDNAIARISNLPHLLAAVLATVGADGGPLAMTLAAGSFTDGTRVAGTRPELVRAMCEGNAVALLPVLDDALGRLGVARGALASTGTVGATAKAGHRARAELDHIRANSAGAELRLDLTAPDAREALLGLADHGAIITDIEGSTLLASLPTR